MSRKMKGERNSGGATDRQEERKEKRRLRVGQFREQQQQQNAELHPLHHLPRYLINTPLLWASKTASSKS